MKKLRFAVGDKVECNTGGPEWSKGEIYALMYPTRWAKPVARVLPHVRSLRPPAGECNAPATIAALVV